MDAETRQQRLIWIDLEMTGLDSDRDGILEIATVVTDGQLEILAEGGWTDWPDKDLVLASLERTAEVRAAPWTTWPVPEREAVADFLARFGP